MDDLKRAKTILALVAEMTDAAYERNTGFDAGNYQASEAASCRFLVAFRQLKDLVGTTQARLMASVANKRAFEREEAAHAA